MDLKPASPEMRLAVAEMCRIRDEYNGVLLVRKWLNRRIGELKQRHQECIAEIERIAIEEIPNPTKGAP